MRNKELSYSLLLLILHLAYGQTYETFDYGLISDQFKDIDNLQGVNQVNMDCENISLITIHK